MKKDAARPEVTDAVRACGRYFLLAGTFSLAINLLFLTFPIFLLQVYDRVLTSRSEETLVMLVIAALIALATMGALDAVRARLLIRAGVRLDARLSSRVFKALVERSVFPAAGGARAQPLRDLDNFRQVVTGNGVHALFDAPWVPIYIAVIFLIHPLLGVIALGGAVLLFALALINEFATRKPLKAANTALLSNYAFTEVNLRNAEVVQALGMFQALKARWLQERQTVLGHQAVASDRAALITSISKVLRLFLQVAILGAGAALAIQQLITPGAMFAGMILLSRALMPVEQAIAAWRPLMSARESVRRVNALLADHPPREAGMPLPQPAGRLAVERVIFVPPGTDRPALKQVSFALAPSEALGIIGPSAAGKSTLARLLVGVWQPAAGSVRLDGADVSAWDRVDFGRHVGYLPQDVELLAGTIHENIARFGEARSEDVIDAAEKADVHQMILHLPEGYDTEIGEGGAVLSAGQRQRIALARALFGKPRLVVLDEPNSNLDSEGEEALVECLVALKEAGTTVVIIAHRPNILNTVDKMMLLRDGAVELFGPRPEVMARMTRGVIRPVAVIGGASGQERDRS